MHDTEDVLESFTVEYWELPRGIIAVLVTDEDLGLEILILPQEAGRRDEEEDRD